MDFKFHFLTLISAVLADVFWSDFMEVFLAFHAAEVFPHVLISDWLSYNFFSTKMASHSITCLFQSFVEFKFCAMQWFEN